MKLALTYIIKDDTEANLFERSLKSFMPFFDGLYVVVTGTSGKHDEIHKLVKKYKGKSISTSPETHPDIYATIDDKVVFANFAVARNLSFDLVEDGYDFISWADVDDVVRSGEEIIKAAELAKEKNYDAVFFTYWYGLHFNETTGEIMDVSIPQIRERLLKPKVFKWVSRLHEVTVAIGSYRPKQFEWTLENNRQCVWVHLTEQQRVDSALIRNKDILEIQAKEENYKDPRTLVNLAKVYFDFDNNEYNAKTKELLLKYLDLSGWDEERSDACEYLGLVFEREKDYRKAIEYYHLGIKEHPKNSILFLRLANAYFELNLETHAREWLDIAVTRPLPKASAAIYEPYEIKYLGATLKMKEAQRLGNIDDALHYAQKRVEISGADKDGMFSILSEQKQANDCAKGLLSYAKWLKEHKFEHLVPKIVDTLPNELAELPFARLFSNQEETKKVHDDKSIVYFASFGVKNPESWSPSSLDRGLGGSETAVVQLAKRWAKEGYNVTVYCDCGDMEGDYDGVKYLNYWKINWHDEFNTLILWRSAHLLDLDIKAKRLYMDLHDIASQLDWTPERIAKIDKIFFKSEYHRSNLPKVPDDKCVIIGNGICTN